MTFKPSTEMTLKPGTEMTLKPFNQTCFNPSNFTSFYGICSNFCYALSSPAPNATPEFVAPSVTGNSYLDFFIGLGLAVGQSGIDAFSFLFNKKAQNRLAERGVSAAEGSYQYLKEWLWWLGMILSIYYLYYFHIH